MLAELARAPLTDLLDIAVIVSEGMDFDQLLKNWEQELRTFHVIFLVDDTVATNHLPEVPDWIMYELHTADSIRSALGINSWIVGSRFGKYD